MKNTIWLAVTTLLMCGCLSARDYGDRAFEEQKFNEAINYYEQAIKDGEKDPEMFRRAAMSALNTGDFSGAERYYSQSLRYGAGIEVARELAEFYVKTNNFVSAVRVYQYLLDHEANVQPVYNNLGTALMYASKPFEAESYLMIAQQLDPQDPYPYLNLGILYDQHLRRPSAAVGFYRCYLDLATVRDESYQLASQRIEEVENKYGVTEPIVTCGEPFEPKPDKPVANLREALGEGEIDLGFDGDGSASTVVVERLVTEPVTQPTPAVSGKAINGDTAWSEGRWSDVVRNYSDLAVADLDSVRRFRLGAAELKLGHAASAISWLQLSLASSEDPATVALLIDAYRAVGDSGSITRLCDQYGKRDAYKDATKSCDRKAEPKENPPQPR